MSGSVSQQIHRQRKQGKKEATNSESRSDPTFDDRSQILPLFVENVCPHPHRVCARERELVWVLLGICADVSRRFRALLYAKPYHDTQLQGICPQMTVGMSTVPYTAMAVLHTVSIQPLAVPYLSHIDEFESGHRYSTVITTAVYGSRRLCG